MKFKNHIFHKVMFSSILVFKFAFFNFLVKLETLIFNDRRKIKFRKKKKRS